VKKRFLLTLLLLPMLGWASNFSDAMRAYKQGNFKEAKQLFELAIEEDGAEQAQFFLGLLYLQGKGVEQDIVTAKRYLLKAAELGNARAKCYLGEAYLLQKRPDKQMALKLLKEGHAAGAEECGAIAARYKIPL
jgi:TPR repeat protein